MLPTLPPELLSRSFAYITSKKTLASLALCSKDIYENAVPYLYHCVEIHDEDMGKRGEESEGGRTLKHLTSLFLRKPSLALNVRELRIRGEFSDNAYPNPPPFIPRDDARSQDLDAKVKEAIFRVASNVVEESDWLRDFPLSDDAVLALLLITLPMLERLDVSCPIRPQHVKRVLLRVGSRDAPFDSNLALTRLHDICWVHADKEYGTGMAIGSFTIPSLRRLFMHHMGSHWHEENGGLDDMKSASSGIEHLELKTCRFNPQEITDILRVPKALKTFIYEFGSFHVGYCAADFPAIRQGLEQHKTSLQDLWLDLHHEEESFQAGGDCTRLWSFQDFTRLKRLRLSTVYVFGCSGVPQWDSFGEEDPVDPPDDFEMTPDLASALRHLLPPNIEAIRFTHCEEGQPRLLFTSLIDLLEHKSADCAPSLSAITIEISRLATAKHYDTLIHILHLTQALGISMRVLWNRGERKGEDYEKRVERKWGMDEDIEWAVCTSKQNRKHVYETIDLPNFALDPETDY